MKRLSVAALGVTLALVGITPATADHSGDGAFQFTIAIDEDGDLHAENAALDIRYERNLRDVVPTLDARAGWIDGDRMGYSCGYSFLVYRGFIVGRVTIRKFRDPEDPTSAYVELQDKFMHEGALNFNGTVPVQGNIAGGGEPSADHGRSCKRRNGLNGAAPQDYEPLRGAGEVPVVTFQHGPHAIDIRDFGDQLDVDVEDPTVVFDLVRVREKRVVIVAYQDNGKLPVAAIYYRLMPDIERGLEVGQRVPGTQHSVSLHVGCGLHCMDSHDH